MPWIGRSRTGGRSRVLQDGVEQRRVAPGPMMAGTKKISISFRQVGGKERTAVVVKNGTGLELGGEAFERRRKIDADLAEDQVKDRAFAQTRNIVRRRLGGREDHELLVPPTVWLCMASKASSGSRARMSISAKVLADGHAGRCGRVRGHRPGAAW